jgi:hypothetical protein
MMTLLFLKTSRKLTAELIFSIGPEADVLSLCNNYSNATQAYIFTPTTLPAVQAVPIKQTLPSEYWFLTLLMLSNKVASSARHKEHMPLITPPLYVCSGTAPV